MHLSSQESLDHLIQITANLSANSLHADESICTYMVQLNSVSQSDPVVCLDKKGSIGYLTWLQPSVLVIRSWLLVVAHAFFHLTTNNNISKNEYPLKQTKTNSFLKMTSYFMFTKFMLFLNTRKHKLQNLINKRILQELITGYTSISTFQVRQEFAITLSHSVLSRRQTNGSFVAFSALEDRGTEYWLPETVSCEQTMFTVAFHAEMSAITLGTF